MLVRHFTFSLWFYRTSRISNFFLPPSNLKSLCHPPWFLKSLCHPFLCHPPEDLKSLCHPTFMPPPKNLMPPRLCHPWGWHKKKGGGVKKKKPMLPGRRLWHRTCKTSPGWLPGSIFERKSL